MCAGGGRGEIYTDARDIVIFCWSLSYSSAHITKQREIMKHRAPASPLTGCLTDRLESGCILPSQLPHLCPLCFVRVCGRVDLTTVSLTHFYLGIVLIPFFIIPFFIKLNTLGEIKHSNMKYNLIKKKTKQNKTQNSQKRTYYKYYKISKLQKCQCQETD